MLLLLLLLGSYLFLARIFFLLVKLTLEFFHGNDFVLQIIHRDLAARNVLVGEGEKCKVTDFGMARDVQLDNIYTKQSRVRILRIHLFKFLNRFSLCTERRWIRVWYRVNQACEGLVI